jgi:hypothetical protein
MIRIHAGPKATDHAIASGGPPATSQPSADPMMRAAQSETASSRRRMAPWIRAALPPRIGVTAARDCRLPSTTSTPDSGRVTPVC